MKNLSDKGKGDITAQEDFAIGVMNLISLEEHLLFSFMKSNQKEYLHIYEEIRKLRIVSMKKLLTNFSSEIWCCSKHLLSSTMRFLETGAKFLSDGKEEDAIKFYKMAFDMYSLFWFLQNMGGGKSNDSKKSSKKAKQAKTMEK